MADEPHLYYFFGRECIWCEKMHPLVDLLEHKEKVKLIQLEVWHNPQNQEVLRKFLEPVKQACGGKVAVPAFYNAKTGQALCGYVDYNVLKKWALG